MCSKGAECRFAHIDEQGNDVHNYPEVDEQDLAKYDAQLQKALQEDFEEFDLNEVGEKEESCDEEGSFRLPPHLGIYEGIGPQYVALNLKKCTEIRYRKNQKLRQSNPRKTRPDLFLVSFV